MFVARSDGPINDHTQQQPDRHRSSAVECRPVVSGIDVE